MQIEENLISEISNELERRRKILIMNAKNRAFPMDKLDRADIVLYLEEGKLPERPDSIPGLMKAFIKSCFTYSVLRNFCRKKMLGEIPTPDTIPECLARIFNSNPFRLEETWYPDQLKKLAGEIQALRCFDLSSNKPESRMICVLLDGSTEMKKRLENGMPSFFSEIEKVTKSDSETIWKYVEDFSGAIYNVGPALISDFLKEIGFAQFVKVDHHFQKQFPTLFKINCGRMSPKQHFVLSQKLSERIKMTPYHLDRILYEWGRYGANEDRTT